MKMWCGFWTMLLPKKSFNCLVNRHKMKNRLLCLLLFISLSACNNSQTICDLPEDSRPGWMEELISELEKGSAFEYHYIVSGKFQGLQVFVLKNCCPFCNSVFVVYNCSGEELGMLGGKIEDQDVTQQEYYWAPAAAECSINQD